MVAVMNSRKTRARRSFRTMFACTLVIAHPPHGRFDAARAAPALGLTPADLTLKANYSVPEIWAVKELATEARDAARTAQEAGFHLALVPDRVFTAVPYRTRVVELHVKGDGILAVTGSQQIEVPWDDAVVGVYFAPRAGETVARGAPRASAAISTQDAPCESPFLDLYLSRGDEIIRLAVLVEATHLSGLDDAAALSPAGRLARFVNVAEKRFPRGAVDRRLVNMQLRHPHQPSLGPGQLLRKGYSFASPGLGDLLAKLAPHLVSATHCEFASRLCYLSARYGGGQGAGKRGE
jgi:hypothetical protein